MTRDDAIASLYLAGGCLAIEEEPNKHLDTWFYLKPMPRAVFIDEEIAGLAYTLMSIAVAEVPTL